MRIKEILAIIIATALIFFIWWLLTAMPTPEEKQKGEELKAVRLSDCWSYPEFTGKDCI
jgi:hypothetical protein